MLVVLYLQTSEMKCPVTGAKNITFTFWKQHTYHKPYPKLDR